MTRNHAHGPIDMLFPKAVLIIFECVIGLMSYFIVWNLHVQGAYRHSIVPITRFIFANPWIHLLPLLYGLFVALYLARRCDSSDLAQLQLTRIAVSVIYLIVMIAVALLPIIKLFELLGVPDGA